jgi:hypothetical protein
MLFFELHAFKSQLLWNALFILMELIRLMSTFDRRRNKRVKWIMFNILRLIKITSSKQRVFFRLHNDILILIIVFLLLKESSITQCLDFQQRIKRRRLDPKHNILKTKINRYNCIINPNTFDCHLIHCKCTCLVTSYNSCTSKSF